MQQEQPTHVETQTKQINQNAEGLDPSQPQVIENQVNQDEKTRFANITTFQNVQKQSIKQGIEQDRDENASTSDKSQSNPYQCQIVLSEDCANQIVTVLIEPGQTIWYKGQIIASNRPYSNKDIQPLDRIDIQRILHYFKLKWNIPKKLTNAGPDMAYFCIRKKFGGGKILHLKQEVYNQSFIIDFSKLLTINCDPIQFQLKSVNYIPYLSKIKLKNQNTKLTLLLQSNPGNMIYEKSLSPDEKLYLGNSNIIAMSQNIRVMKEEHQLVLAGYGYVFIEAPSTAIPIQNINNVLITTIFVTFFIFTLFLMFTI